MWTPSEKLAQALYIANEALIDLPVPANLSIWWNFGSTLEMYLMIQVIMGLILSTHYSPHTDLAFSSVARIMQDVNYGWAFRYVHANEVWSLLVPSNMYSPLRKTHPAIKITNNALIDLPVPANLSIWWNFGSMLGMCLMIQVITGLILSMHYSPHTDLAFSSVAHIMRDINYGWALRYVHANGGSWFFMCIYLHIARGVYYGSYMYLETWNIGVILVILVMATAFVGYVLPWGQMSFWGATVITNLLSAIPYIGAMLVEWVWGGFAVDNATLNRFFALHFLMPFIVMALSMLHLLFLHQTGSSNPLGIKSSMNMVPFHMYHTLKDTVGFAVLLMSLTFIALFFPNILGDAENFIPANPLVTPVHIKPEWYFLWAYAILRSIPNKLGGVVAMFAAILVLFALPLMAQHKARGVSFYPVSQVMFWLLSADAILLTWIGGRPVEYPFEGLGQIFTALYFILHLSVPLSARAWDNMIK